MNLSKNNSRMTLRLSAGNVFTICLSVNSHNVINKWKTSYNIRPDLIVFKKNNFNTLEYIEAEGRELTLDLIWKAFHILYLWLYLV